MVKYDWILNRVLESFPCLTHIIGIHLGCPPWSYNWSVPRSFKRILDNTALLRRWPRRGTEITIETENTWPIWDALHCFVTVCQSQLECLKKSYLSVSRRRSQCHPLTICVIQFGVTWRTLGAVSLVLMGSQCYEAPPMLSTLILMRYWKTTHYIGIIQFCTSRELLFRHVITDISLQPYTTWPTYLINI